MEMVFQRKKNGRCKDIKKIVEAAGSNSPSELFLLWKKAQGNDCAGDGGADIRTHDNWNSALKGK